MEESIRDPSVIAPLGYFGRQTGIERERSVTADHHRALRDWSDQFSRMPELLDVVQALWSADFIEDPNKIGAQKNHSPAMKDRRPGAFTIDPAELRCILTVKDAGGRRSRPCKWRDGDRLVKAVHSNRIMRGGAAKTIPPYGVAVRVCPRIDEGPLGSAGQHNAERIGMAMARAPRAEFTSIEHEMYIPLSQRKNAGAGE